MSVRIEALDLFWIRMHMVGEFKTSFGTQRDRDILLVRVRSDGLDGWGESGADGFPGYSYETARTGWHIIEDFVGPEVLARPWPDEGIGAAVAAAFAVWRWHPMARAAVEEALWDLEARRRGISLADLYAGERHRAGRIPAGISLGIQPDFETLASQIEAALERNYRRIKLKIQPGADVAVVEAVRERFGDIPLMVDGNCGYTPQEADALLELDRFDLMMIEQPLAHDDLHDHADLQAKLRTPLCLDEAIKSPGDARRALELGSCRIVNIKASRLGGRTAALEVHDACADRGVPVWCGGMLESGVGRLHNVALASLPNFRIPGDISASSRYWAEDIIIPEVELDEDGYVGVPDEVGLDGRVVEELVRKHLVRHRTLVQ